MFSSLGVMGIALLILGVVVVFGIAALLAYKKVDQGQALVINRMNKVDVSFNGAFYIPVFNRVETMDISLKTIQIDRRGKDGLICSDNIRADITVTFFVRVNKTEEDVRKVAQAVGCDRASDQDKIEELFTAKFSEALKTVGKNMEFEDLYGERLHFRDQILQEIGQDLNGYKLDDAAIDYLEQTPVEDLDDQNVLDSQGIKKITKITSQERVQANELSNEEEKKKGKDDLETKKALLEYERQEADAEAKQQREIKVVKSQQQAQANEIQAQENARAEKAEVEAQEEVEIRKIEAKREKEVADKNRERVLAVEDENVEKERQLQVIARERETELKRIEKNREVETEEKGVAEARRERIAVEKTVAEEEEEIEKLRTVKEAEREKEAQVIAAEGEAQENLISDIKQAEAQEKVAEHESREEVVRADAEVDAAERIAKAKKQRAEGVQAEEAASGLADVQIKEAEAQAQEKQGMVDAKVKKENMLAEAEGEEEQGMVDIKLRKERANATEKEGLAEAKVTREQGEAEASATKQKEQAEAAGIRARGEAEADTLEQKEKAEATGIKEKMAAEAEGLADKATAIDSFDDQALDHEEFRMKLELDETLGSQRIDNSVDIAEAQAKVMSEALNAADINIVGGNDGFYENFMRSISAGHAIEGFMDTSPTAKNAVTNMMGGNGTPADSNGTPAGSGAAPAGDGTGDTDALDLSMLDLDGDGETRLTELLNAVMGEADDEGKTKIKELIDMVENTELDRLDSSASST